MKSTSASPAITVTLLVGLFALRYAPSPLAVLLLVSTPFLLIYIVAPIAIYCSVRSPSRPKMEPVAPADPSVPTSQCESMLAQIESLHHLGFVPVGNWFRSSESARRDKAVAAVFQHRESTDIATVIATKCGVVVGFSRARSNGGKTRTLASTHRSALPHNPNDSLVRIKGRCDTSYLWMLHRARVSKDPLAAHNAPLVNAFAHQMYEEMDSIKHHLSSGYFKTDKDGAQMRPTAFGAVMMTLRLAAPTAYVFEWSDRLTLADTVSKLRLATQWEYAREQSGRNAEPAEPMRVLPGTRTAMA
ncbi:MAG TPA: hypothetical protein VKX17_15180 [Planctomycetota bacterium]|nr:hypothetical protein [Planctomycetota bacterium]